jgi:hypothetical protein
MNERQSLVPWMSLSDGKSTANKIDNKLWDLPGPVEVAAPVGQANFVIFPITTEGPHCTTIIHSLLFAAEYFMCTLVVSSPGHLGAFC